MASNVYLFAFYSPFSSVLSTGLSRIYQHLRMFEWDGDCIYLHFAPCRI